MPLQSSSTRLHTLSLAAGSPGRQESSTCPAAQLVLPVAVQAPMPQVVASALKSSSNRPSQSSSTPSQLVSIGPVAVQPPGAGLSSISSSKRGPEPCSRDANASEPFCASSTFLSSQ